MDHPVSDSGVDDDVAAARAAIDAFWSGWERLEPDAVLDTLVPDDTLVFIGTDANEYWQGYRAVVGPFRAMTDAFAEERVVWRPGDPRIEVVGDVAWASGRLHTTVIGLDREAVETDVRATFVLRRADDEWRIAQAHISIAPSSPVAAY